MKRIAIRAIVVIGIAAFYTLSLFGYHRLATSSVPLGPPDVGAATDTVVLVTLESLRPIDHRLAVKVLVLPDDSLLNSRLGVLNTDISVRLYPANELGDLGYPAGEAPSQVSTTVVASGDPNNWPFDSYTTPIIQADVLVGSGDDREYLPARVEVTGSLEGWDMSSERSGGSTQSEPDRGDDASITLRRAKGPLVFDLGICLILLSLPVMALFVVTEIVRGKKKLSLSFLTWFSAMLFAVVPIRNILPGSPPFGGWIDQALVVWVLIALVAAMAIFIITWYRRPD
jgi:hypothetical protein